MLESFAPLAPYSRALGPLGLTRRRLHFPACQRAGRPEGSVPAAGHDGGVGAFHHGGFHFGLHLQRCVFPQRQQQRRPRRCWAPTTPRNPPRLLGLPASVSGRRLWRSRDPLPLAPYAGRGTDDPGGSRRRRTLAARLSFAPRPEMGVPSLGAFHWHRRPRTAVSRWGGLSRPATDSGRSRLVLETQRLPLPGSGFETNEGCPGSGRNRESPALV